MVGEILVSTNCGPFIMKNIMLNNAKRLLVSFDTEVDIAAIINDPPLLEKWYKGSYEEVKNELNPLQLFLLNAPSHLSDEELISILNMRSTAISATIMRKPNNQRNEALITFKTEQEASLMLNSRILPFERNQIGFFTRKPRTNTTTIVTAGLPPRTGEWSFWGSIRKSDGAQLVYSLTVFA